MGLAFEQGENAGRADAIKELHLIWQDIYRTIGKQKYTTEALRFAATLKAPKDASHKRPLDEQKSLETLVGLAGVKPKQVINRAKWLQSVVKAEDQLLAESPVACSNSDFASAPCSYCRIASGDFLLQNRLTYWVGGSASHLEFMA